MPAAKPPQREGASVWSRRAGLRYTARLLDAMRPAVLFDRGGQCVGEVKELDMAGRATAARNRRAADEAHGPVAECPCRGAVDLADDARLGPPDPVRCSITLDGPDLGGRKVDLDRRHERHVIVDGGDGLPDAGDGWIRLHCLLLWLFVP